jgi:hypothetical protein
MKHSVLISALTIAICGCGGSTPPPATPTQDQGESHHGGGHHEHGENHDVAKLPASLREFHSVLAPVWHMEKGADRVTKTCAQASALRDKATAVQTSPVPEHATEAAWKAAAGALVNAVTALVTECGKEGHPDVDARLSDVHTNFHELVEQLGH